MWQFGTGQQLKARRLKEGDNAESQNCLDQGVSRNLGAVDPASKIAKGVGYMLWGTRHRGTLIMAWREAQRILISVVCETEHVCDKLGYPTKEMSKPSVAMHLRSSRCVHRTLERKS